MQRAGSLLRTPEKAPWGRAFLICLALGPLTQVPVPGDGLYGGREDALSFTRTLVPAFVCLHPAEARAVPWSHRQLCAP